MLLKIWKFLQFIDWRIIEYGQDIPYEVRYYLRRLFMALSYIKPVIQYDSDYAVTNGLFVVMVHKLRRVKKEMRHLVNSDKYKKEVSWAIDRLEEIINYRFENDEIQAHKDKWGEPKIAMAPQRVFMYPKAKGDEEQEQAAIEMVSGIRRAAKKRQEKIKEVMIFIAENADKWWD